MANVLGLGMRDLDRRFFDVWPQTTKGFKENGNPVIAIGDSEVDELMMQQSDIAIMAHNHKCNRDLLPGLLEVTKVYQWSQTGESEAISDYPSISTSEIIRAVEGAFND